MQLKVIPYNVLGNDAYWRYLPFPSIVLYLSSTTAFLLFFKITKQT